MAAHPSTRRSTRVAPFAPSPMHPTVPPHSSAVRSGQLSRLVPDGHPVFAEGARRTTGADSRDTRLHGTRGISSTTCRSVVGSRRLARSPNSQAHSGTQQEQPLHCRSGISREQMVDFRLDSRPSPTGKSPIGSTQQLWPRGAPASGRPRPHAGAGCCFFAPIARRAMSRRTLSSSLRSSTCRSSPAA